MYCCLALPLSYAGRGDSCRLSALTSFSSKPHVSRSARNSSRSVGQGRLSSFLLSTSWAQAVSLATSWRVPLRQAIKRPPGVHIHAVRPILAGIGNREKGECNHLARSSDLILAGANGLTN